MRLPPRSRPLLAILSIALAYSQSTLAQESFFEEVVVTAEKRETTLQDTAIAVSAFSQLELDNGLISNNMDIQMSVPNMLMSNGYYDIANISIRGIGNTAVGPAADPGTGVHFNGVYLNGSRIFETAYYDTQRVEVLRGPQGTLYGRNTTAGVINIITQKPTEEFGGDVELQIGDYGHTQARAALNIPLTNTLWQRFSGFYLQRDGFVDNLFTGDDQDGRDMYALRSSTTWQVTDRTDATLVIDHFEEDSDRMRGSGMACRKDDSGVLGCFAGGLENQISHSGAGITGLLMNTVGAVTGQAYPADDFLNSINPANPREVVLDFEPVYEADESIFSLEINHDFDSYTLTSLTGYHESGVDARNDYDFAVASEPWPVEVSYDRGPDGPLTVDRASSNDRARNDTEQWSQELRLASDRSGGVNFLLGAFWLSYKSDVHFTVYSSALERYGEVFAIPAEQRIFDVDNKDYELTAHALFGELYFDLNDKTELTLGLRYTDEEKSSDLRITYLAFADLPTAANNGYADLQADSQETTGRVNIKYHLSESAMAFLTLARSYKSGGFNPVNSTSALLDPALGGDPSLAEFDPEYINSIELGIKSRLFNDTLQANVSYFYYDYEGLQVSKIVAQTAINENVDSIIQGLEGEFVWAPDQHWTINVNMAWLDTEVGDFQTFDPADPNQLSSSENILSGGNFNTYLPCGCPGIEVDLEGNQLASAPEFSVNLGLSYGLSLDSGMSIELSAMYYYQDEFYARIFNTVNDQMDSWDVWNAKAVLSSANEDWYAETWVRNINDDDHRTGQHLQDAAVGLYSNYQLLEPRTYGVTLGYHF